MKIVADKIVELNVQGLLVISKEEVRDKFIVAFAGNDGIWYCNLVADSKREQLQAYSRFIKDSLVVDVSDLDVELEVNYR